MATTTAPAAGRRTAAGTTFRRPKKGGGLTPWLFALPAIAIYLVFLVYPAFSSVFFSFTDYDGNRLYVAEPG